MCVEVSLARNEPSVRGGQSWTKTIGIKVCGSFCHSTGTGIEPRQQILLSLLFLLREYQHDTIKWIAAFLLREYQHDDAIQWIAAPKLTEIVEVEKETWQGAKFGVC